MSLNYPDREDWLKVRNTPRKIKRERMVWQATNLVRIKDGPAKGQVIMMGKGKTYVRPEPKDVHGRGRRRRQLIRELSEAPTCAA